MTRLVFGLGGGSDFNTAWLFSEAGDKIITALAPVILSGEINIDQTVRKYTGQVYSVSDDGSQDAIEVYSCYSIMSPSDTWPVLIDSRKPHSYGLIVPSPAYADAFLQCSTKLRELAHGCEIIAVDTGGDCLRGLVGNMGDNDISSLYNNVRDTRDTDSITVIRHATNKAVEIIICGPGSDGETVGSSLSEALQILEERTEGSPCKLIYSGKMAQLRHLFTQVPGWSDPTSGSTISNIVHALDAPIGLFSVIRRGRVVSNVSSEVLRSFWVVRLPHQS